MRRTATRLARILSASDFWVPLVTAASLGATAFVLAGGADPWSPAGLPALWGAAAGMFGMIMGLDLCDRSGADTPPRDEG